MSERHLKDILFKDVFKTDFFKFLKKNVLLLFTYFFCSYQNVALLSLATKLSQR